MTLDLAARYKITNTLQLSEFFPPYLSINDLKVKRYNHALFICLKDNLSFRFTFPPVRPAALCQKAFCWGQCGPFGAAGIHKQRGQSKVTETEGPGTLPNEAGGDAASTIWGPFAN